jgi:hypothetical protein
LMVYVIKGNLASETLLQVTNIEDTTSNNTVVTQEAITPYTTGGLVKPDESDEPFFVSILITPRFVSFRVFAFLL